MAAAAAATTTATEASDSDIKWNEFVRFDDSACAWRKSADGDVGMWRAGDGDAEQKTCKARGSVPKHFSEIVTQMSRWPEGRVRCAEMGNGRKEREREWTRAHDEQ